MDIRSMLGQRLALGFSGTELSPEFIELLREYKIGNVILLRKNAVKADQLRSLCESIQEVITEATGYPAFITIDQEGGMVSRLPDDLVNVPRENAGAPVRLRNEIYRRNRKGSFCGTSAGNFSVLRCHVRLCIPLHWRRRHVRRRSTQQLQYIECFTCRSELKTGKEKLRYIRTGVPQLFDPNDC